MLILYLDHSRSRLKEVANGDVTMIGAPGFMLLAVCLSVRLSVCVHKINLPQFLSDKLEMPYVCLLHLYIMFLLQKNSTPKWAETATIYSL